METTGDSGRVGSHQGGELDHAIGSGAVLVANPWVVNRAMFRRFFSFTGGSIFYCVSAVLVAYGVAKVLGPVLSDTDTIGAALPCVGTLWAYEIALLGVLVLIVWRKVVDDAVSVAVIIAIYMVASSVAAGSVAERNLSGAIMLAVAGTLLGGVKLYTMRQFVRIPFGMLSMAGLLLLLVVNYFGPIGMSRLMVGDAAEEAVRRSRWFLIQLGMLAGIGMVVVEAFKVKAMANVGQGEKAAFLQSPVMVYILSLVLLAASGVHQSAIGYMYALDRAVGDFVPMVAVGTFLVLEIVRRFELRYGFLYAGIACVPLAVMGYAIYDKSVYSTGEVGFDIIAYPPVLFGLVGAGLAVVAVRHRWRGLWYVISGCAFGVILTVGYSPERPWDLNTFACGGVVAGSMMLYGIVTMKQHFCIAAVGLMTLGVAISDSIMSRAVGWQLTEMGVVLGVAGIGFTVLYVIFGEKLHAVARIAGLVCLGAFIYDFLGNELNGRYAVVVAGGGLPAAVLWLRTRDWLGLLIPAAALAGRIYMLAKNMAYWRFVILGFIVLAVGAFVSLKKPKPKVIPQTEQIDEVLD